MLQEDRVTSPQKGVRCAILTMTHGVYLYGKGPRRRKELKNDPVHIYRKAVA